MYKKSIQVAAAAIINTSGEVLIAKRPDDKHQGGKWEFPGGKIEQGETVLDALTRELHEELAIQVVTANPLIQITYEYPEKIVQLDVWQVTEFSGDPIGNEGQSIQWVAKTQLFNFQFPPANRPILQALLLPDYYLISGDFEDQADCLRRVQAAIASGIKLIQLRTTEKPIPLDLVKALADYCYQTNVQLLIKQSNCSREIYNLKGISGVHLTVAELMDCNGAVITQYQKQGCLVAASCHNAEEIVKANALALDFITLSPIQPTASHPGQLGLGWKTAQQLIKLAQCPVYCLGGLSSSDVGQARQVGSQGVAGISQFWPS
ncbi:Nudix family hydrolase [Endozoicomonas sp. SM1973]|uniref:8-oxo-dGTP diphosphatase n=1 Tax=Spartinivicinus marinus TaxID=2994442 RepID=A0A853HV75_9GAMM|nr:Nudix family hydrolase [Spartinivicinus marinus]MCX4028325.1 Nudix family hydrolase [Spartinivicinus marinus]NYZ65660.1 Nudix family hydrolase [Spartinivicinus marinus]